MGRLRAFCLTLFMIACLAWPAWGQELLVSGQALGADGRPVAGVVISDGKVLTLSGQSGDFRLATAAGRVVWAAAPPGLELKGRWWLPSGKAAAGLLTLSLSPRPAGEPTLGFVSDSHLFGLKTQPFYFRLGHREAGLPVEAFGRTARFFQMAKVGLVLHSGDLAMDVDKGDYQRAGRQMALAAQAFRGLPSPARAVPGNHDVRYGDDGVDYSIWRKYMGPVRHLYFYGGAAFVFLDNMGPGRTPRGKFKNCGVMSREALEWLGQALEAIPRDTPLVLVTHFPLASTLAGANPLGKSFLVVGGGSSGLSLRDVDQQAAQVLKLLQGRPVAALVNGHEHRYHQARLFGRAGAVQMVAVPSLAGRWWQGDMPWGSLRFPAGFLRGRLEHTSGGMRIMAEFHPTEPHVVLKSVDK